MGWGEDLWRKANIQDGYLWACGCTALKWRGSVPILHICWERESHAVQFKSLLLDMADSNPCFHQNTKVFIMRESNEPMNQYFISAPETECLNVPVQYNIHLMSEIRRRVILPQISLLLVHRFLLFSHSLNWIIDHTLYFSQVKLFDSSV